jgi:hypothetical protein
LVFAAVACKAAVTIAGVICIAATLFTPNDWLNC